MGFNLGFKGLTYLFLYLIVSYLQDCGLRSYIDLLFFLFVRTILRYLLQLLTTNMTSLVNKTLYCYQSRITSNPMRYYSPRISVQIPAPCVHFCSLQDRLNTLLDEAESNRGRSISVSRCGSPSVLLLNDATSPLA